MGDKDRPPSLSLCYSGIIISNSNCSSSSKSGTISRVFDYCSIIVDVLGAPSSAIATSIPSTKRIKAGPSVRHLLEHNSGLQSAFTGHYPASPGHLLFPFSLTSQPLPLRLSIRRLADGFTYDLFSKAAGPRCRRGA